MGERSTRVLTALMALEEAIAAEGDRATVTLPAEIGHGARRSFAERLCNGRPVGPGRDFAAGTVALKSGFRWGRLTVLWANPASRHPTQAS